MRLKRFFCFFVLLIPLLSHAAVTVQVNGTSHTIPQTNERGWGNNVTAWIQAISANTLQPNGGNFTLTDDVDFGANFGLKSHYFSSRDADSASAGLIRLANTDVLSWRNQANDGDLTLSVNASDVLEFDGKVLMTSGDIVDADIAPNAAISYSKLDLAGEIVDADIASDAAIDRSKIAAGTADHVVIHDGSGALSSEAYLSKSRGGAGADMSSVTFPATGTIVTEDGTQTLTNKIISGSDNTITDVDASDVVVTPSGNLSSSDVQSALEEIQGDIDLLGALPTGVGMDYWGSTPPTGWVLAYGTIGNGSSGASNRANDDTEALFTLLWNSMSDTQAPVSGGRGVSAAADFAANKTIGVPDKRGRVSVGKDDMGGSAANRMTASGSGVAGTTLGAVGGAETHTLTASQIPPHSHPIGLRTGTSTGSAQMPPGNNDTGIANATYNSGTNGGGGNAHNNTQPSIILNYIIKL